MPIYEYQCQACNHKFEIIQKMSDELLLVCPECKEKKLRKLVTAAAFVLKGTGWYATDFKDKKQAQNTGKTENKAETAGKSDAASSTGSAKSDPGSSTTADTSKKESSTDSKSSKSTKTASD